MIPNDSRFVEAIHEKKNVCVRFYSKADSGLLDRVCAPMDLHVLGEVFDRAHLDAGPVQWSIPRDWDSQSQSVDEPIGALLTVAT